MEYGGSTPFLTARVPVSVVKESAGKGTLLRSGQAFW